MTEQSEETLIKHPDISQITDYVYLSSFPKEEYAQHILSLNIRMIITMTPYRPDSVYRQPPFQFVQCPALDSPWVPIPQFMLRRGVSAALPVIAKGESVLVHCREGIHRSVATTCCILVAQGYTAEEAMSLVKAKRDKADPYAGYIRKRIEIFENDWRKNHE